jgi:hypothetical protein
VTLPLRVALDQCLRHASLMKSALADLPNPLDAGAVAADEDFLIRAIDQFVLRFIKLQDTLGEHVLRAFASEVLAEPVSDLPMIDVLARLERYGFLDSVQWARWRALRNSLTHEYPGHPETRIAVLEEARAAAGALDRLVEQLDSRLARQR